MPSTSPFLPIFLDKPGGVALPILLQLLLASSSFAGTARVPISNELKAAVAAQQHLLQPDGRGYRGENARQKFALHFDRDNASVTTNGADVRIRLAAYGRESKWKTPKTAVVKASGARADYQRDNVAEWYVNSADGLEQGFTFAKRPEGNGALELKLAVHGGLSPRLETRDAVVLQRQGQPILRYSGLKAWDSSGRILAAFMEVKNCHIRLIVDDAEAAYPVTIDPILQQAKLTAPDGVVGDDLGYSVAINGTTALVGAFGKADYTGAAYVYVQSGTTWIEQAKLAASDGGDFNNFGTTVALSGNTALVGAFENSGSIGAVYVFVRNGTTWSQQAKLKASNGHTSDQFGFSVALDGTTAIIGALDANSLAGSAYVFVRNGTAWTQQAELTASDGAAFDGFGNSVAVSGTVAVVGARNHASNGAAYVFVQSGKTWTQQAKLLASDGGADDSFGSAVALNGNTALIGARNNDGALGAAYVYVQNGTTWAQQAKLTASGGVAGDEFGYSVTVNGNTALVGAPFQSYATGSAYLFIRSGSVWVQQSKINAADYALSDQFGNAVAFNGNLGVVGAPFKAESVGAAYVYATPLTSSTPALGNPGSVITVAGSGFVPNETIYIVWNLPRLYLVSAVADATGSFSGVSVTVPASAAIGLNTIYASGETAKDLGIGYFTVQ